MTCGMTWKIEQVRLDRSMDRGGMPRCTMMAIRLDVTNITMPGPKTTDGLHPSYVATWPDIEAPHTPSASLNEFPEGFKPVNIESYDGTTDQTHLNCVAM